MTIVVLLILAGITINFLFGENGIIAKAQIAKDEQEKAKVEEMLNLKYLDKMIDGRGKVSSNVLTTMFNELKKEGYEVEQRGDTEVKGLLFQDSTGKNIDTLNIEQDTSITVKISLITENGSDTKSYVKIGNKYYEIIVNGKITLAKEGLDKLDGISHDIKITKPTSGITIKTKLDDSSEETEITEGSTIASGTSLILSAGNTVGDYTFNVKVENSSYTTNVTAHVVANPLYATRVTISSTNGAKTVHQGENIQLKAILEPNTSTDTVSWSVTDGISIASIDVTGNVSINSSAAVDTKVTVKATMKRGEVETGITDTFDLKVSANPLYATGIEIRSVGNSTTIVQGESIQLTAVLEPNTSTDTVNWSITDGVSIASIDEKGKVTAYSEAVVGNTITVKAKVKRGEIETSIEDTITLTVTDQSNWGVIAEWAEYIATHDCVTTNSEGTKVAQRWEGDLDPLKVGDTFSVYYGGTKINTIIVDFKHDELSEGVRYASDTSKTIAGITFAFENSFGPSERLDRYYNETSMRTINTSMYTNKVNSTWNVLDNQLKNVVKKVRKYTIVNGQKTKSTHDTADYSDDFLWLFAGIELNGSSYAYEVEGYPYPYFEDSSKRARVPLNGNSRNNYFLRTYVGVSPYGVNCLGGVGTDGSTSCFGITDYMYFYFGFCI